MRRRMFWQQDFIRYLKSIGCKLYFPFDNKYRLDAAIGDTSVVTYYGGSYFTYDANVDMVQAIMRQLNYIVASIDTNFTADDFPTNEWTLFSQAMRNNRDGATSGTTIFAHVGNNTNLDVVTHCVDEAGTINTENWAENIKYSTFAVIDKDNDVVDRYVYAPDKTLTQSQVVSTVFGKPNKQQRINIYANPSWNVNRRTFLGHMMIFNRKLTDKEMKKIIDYLL